MDYRELDCAATRHPATHRDRAYEDYRRARSNGSILGEPEVMRCHSVQPLSQLAKTQKSSAIDQSGLSCQGTQGVLYAQTDHQSNARAESDMGEQKQP